MSAMHPSTSASWRGVFRDLSREHGFEPLHVEGRLPPALSGTLYRNGPSTFGVGADVYRHWFDGDGAVGATRFGGGAAHGAVRFVDTPWRRAELAAGRHLYRSYAQLGEGWRRWFALPKNPANIAVLPWEGRLLALWEFGRPFALDPDTLETLGQTDLDGALGPTFSAHPHVVAGRTVSFAVRYGPRFSLELYRLDERATRVTTLPLRFPTLVHDFVATERHAIFFCPPLRLDLPGLLSGVRDFDANLRWEPGLGTEVIVVPWASPDRPVRFEVPACFQWHFVNAWEDGEDLVVDSMRYADFATDRWFGRAPWEASPAPPSAYVRTRVDLRARTVTDETVAPVTCEFPGIDPREAGRPHGATFTLLLGDGAPRLARIGSGGAVEAVDLGPDTVPTEPVVAVDAEGHPWVLTQVYDGRQDRSCVAVLDPDRWAEGPVARAWYDHALPFTYHGAWAGRYKP